MEKIGLYIHIPFCKRKCFYCDFCSYADKLDLQEQYINAVIKELDYVSKNKEYLVETVYIGGGTPSIINEKLIVQLINSIKQFFKIDDSAEITIEINPGTASEEKINAYKKAGINRASIGLQSASDKLLEEIGRIHNFNEFEKVYSLVQKVGIDNINVDLMIGLPNQTLDDVEDTLDKIVKKNPSHISVYSLIVEPDTKMEELISNGTLQLPDEDTERKMYWDVVNKLKNCGYNQYEISNFAKKGFESKHNVDCWNQKEYIGAGIAAHSYVNGTRYSNICSIEEYIENIENKNFRKNVIIHETQCKESMMKEYMIIGLRKIEGICINDFEKKFQKDPLNVFKNELTKLKKQNLIDINKSSIKLTKKGMDFANIVWEEFV